METKLMRHYPHPYDFPFWIQRNRHSSVDTPGWHIHEFVELIFVMDGQATHMIQDASYDLRVGDVYVINPGEMHEYVLEERQHIEIFNCMFDPGLISHALLREIDASDSFDFYYVHPFLNKESSFHSKLVLQGEASREALELLDGMEREMRRRDYGFRTVIQLKLAELFLLLSRHYQKKNDKINDACSSGELLVQRVRGYIERHFNHKISLPLLSELFHIGTRQLNRQFKKYIGKTVIEYLHLIRMEHAKKLLVETDEIVAVVARMIGYEDPASFSRLFAREVNCPPGKYRITARK
ncbi:AraC family transcriptional regulator [Paenibacillus oceani]|uniref:Helix-turn-helix transcriptional regulator n=1 Tax=Paenibacillus oceani TaxID=2772510 RepID=A0A927CFA1_9BACL|nr:AraC family transcriptional regulator [Paenibacillus oceani]MBD2864715.1 helix-turn-helix transcriptional regulator [Paenibacillus oceani]